MTNGTHVVPPVGMILREIRLRGCPPCRVCLSKAEVLVFPDDESQTVCPDCCETADHADGETGHRWDYNRHERGHECRYCGIPKACTRFALE